MKMLEEGYILDGQTIDTFRENGWIKLGEVLDKVNLEHFRTEISKVVEKDSRNSLPLEERDTYSKAFLQITNLWEKNSEVSRYTLAKMNQTNILKRTSKNTI